MDTKSRLNYRHSHYKALAYTPHIPKAVSSFDAKALLVLLAAPEGAMAGDDDVAQDVETLLVYYEAQEPEYATDEKVNKVIRSFKKKLISYKKKCDNSKILNNK